MPTPELRLRVDASQGEPEEVSAMHESAVEESEAEEKECSFPDFLPNGGCYLYGITPPGRTY